MCGIAGIFRLTGRPSAEDVAAVLRMMDAQRHRGPDDWGLLVPASLTTGGELQRLLQPGVGDHIRTYPDTRSSSGVVLGTRRLSIIDLSSRGRMPMGGLDARLWISHNGEIYNYRELRAELGRTGGAFRSDSDTEVILRAYAEWGDGVLPRLRGMFAFALFEATPRPRLLLARDRFGIKPLYYYRDRGRLVFASEVQALLQSGLVPDESNVEALVRFLQLGSVPSPQTTIKNVVALPAAHSLASDSDGSSPRPYWSLSDVVLRAADRGAGPASTAVSLGEAVAGTRALLDESARLHLVSDVPLGVFLSGGIDSSALVALASRHRDTPLTTLSVGFEERAYSEAPYARLVAERWRTDHREVVLRAQDLFGGLERIFGAMDEPTVDGVNTYFISEAARRAGLTVVLSGTGGDEVFLGYDHLRDGATLGRACGALAALPVWARRGLTRMARRVGPAVARKGLERLEYLERPSATSLYLAVRGLFSPTQVQDLLGISKAELEAWGPALPALDGSLGRGVDGLGMLEFTHYLQDQLLKDTDVMGMAHSVEVRVPYLDHRLVEWVVGLPLTVRLAGGTQKPLLIKALDGSLPREIWRRPKMGFTLPFDRWIRQRSDEFETISLERKFLERKTVEGIWRAFRSGRLHWSRVWALVVLARFDVRRRRVAA